GRIGLGGAALGLGWCMLRVKNPSTSASAASPPASTIAFSCGVTVTLSVSATSHKALTTCAKGKGAPKGPSRTSCESRGYGQTPVTMSAAGPALWKTEAPTVDWTQ